MRTQVCELQISKNQTKCNTINKTGKNIIELIETTNQDLLAFCAIT